MYGYYWWGMSVWWWLFWTFIVIAFFAFLTPVPRSRHRSTPIEILQRRYAAGELTSQEYEERKAKIERDQAA
jgi:putative membrane protein